MSEDPVEPANLHMSEEVQSLQSAYVTVRANGIITSVNDEFQRITGIESQFFEEHAISEFMKDANNIDLKEIFQSARTAHLDRRNKSHSAKDPIVELLLPDPNDPTNDAKKKKEFFRFASKTQYFLDPSDNRKHPEFLIQLTPITDLQENANIDPLLNIPNRRMLFDQGKRMLRRSELERTPVTVGIIDIDSFKSVNDTHGHAVGDQILKHQGGRLRHNIRPGDLIGRYGGEEFAFILPGADIDKSLDICERIRTAAKEPMDYKSKSADGTLSRTISIGIAYIDPGENLPLEGALNDADLALYAIKHNMKDGVSVYVNAKQPYIVSFQKNDAVNDAIETKITVFSLHEVTDEMSQEKTLKSNIDQNFLVRTHRDGTIDVFTNDIFNEDQTHELQLVDKGTRDTLLFDLNEWNTVQIDTKWVPLFLISPYAPQDTPKRSR